jgi:hypothetical protein
MNAYPPEHALILVAIMPSPQDMEIARLLGWYRIPLRRAPKVVDVDYLAFYQTAAYGEENRWQIQYTAEVRGHELTTRAELLHGEADHPRAHEEYYKIVLGSLTQLPEPIYAGDWKRVTFFYTTGEYLKAARRLEDLVVHSEERQLLWSSLRERAIHAGQYTSEQLLETPADDDLTEMLGLLAAAGYIDKPLV